MDEEPWNRRTVDRRTILFEFAQEHVDSNISFLGTLSAEHIVDI